MKSKSLQGDYQLTDTYMPSEVLLPAKKWSIRGNGSRPHYLIRVSDAEKYMEELPRCRVQESADFKAFCEARSHSWID